MEAPGPETALAGRLAQADKDTGTIGGIHQNP